MAVSMESNKSTISVMPQGEKIVMVGDNLPSPVEIGLTDWKNIGGGEIEKPYNSLVIILK